VAIEPGNHDIRISNMDNHKSDDMAAARRILSSFPANSGAVVIGGGGGIGRALVEEIGASDRFAPAVSLGRRSTPPLDLLDEGMISAAADHVRTSGLQIRLIIVASGFLHGCGFMPEKSRDQIDPDHMARAFAVNAIGPALVAKHFLPLLPREGKSVFAAISARVGSIEDNRMGGWYSYRASKAALNQIIRTSAVELVHRRSKAICVALHPGTVDTGLSAPFSKAGLDVRPPATAAAEILSVIDGLGPDDSGGFFDHQGKRVPW
jgi:NAD(P)-dependent dehydrogenase (short-subunit alcohol dehydrogenase family)